MEMVSVAIVIILTGTLSATVFGKYRPSIILALGMVLCFGVSYFMTGGHMEIVFSELGNNIQSVWDLWRIITSGFIHRDVVHLAICVIFLLLFGLQIDKRITNISFFMILMIGVSIVSWSWSNYIGFDYTGIGANIIVAVLAGVILVMIPRIKWSIPWVGATKLEMWHLVVIWAIVETLYCIVYLPNRPFVVLLFPRLFGFIFGMLLMAISRSRHIPWTIYRRWYVHINIQSLEPLCVTENQKRTYEELSKIDDWYFRDLCIKIFVNKLSCPECGKKYMVVGNKVVCQNGHMVKNQKDILN